MSEKNDDAKMQYCVVYGKNDMQYQIDGTTTTNLKDLYYILYIQKNLLI